MASLTIDVDLEAVLTEDVIAAARAELRETDGEPMESPWHRAAINLMIDSVIWHHRGRTDYFAGGNMFIYYSREQTRNWKYKGPDFFFVKNVDGTRQRLYWWVFEEGGRFPNMIMELLSPSTEKEDRTTKKDLYQKIFKTPDFFCYDAKTHQLEGWRLAGQYEPMKPNEHGWLWSEELQLWIGNWSGIYQGVEATWVRFFDQNQQLVLTQTEYEHQRAESLQEKVARLEKLLTDKGIPPPNT